MAQRPGGPGRAASRRRLAHWDEYTSTLNTDYPPQAAHLTIDNRLGAAISLAAQTRRALTKLMA